MVHTFASGLGHEYRKAGGNVGKAKCNLTHKAKSLVCNVQGSQQITGRAP